MLVFNNRTSTANYKDYNLIMVLYPSDMLGKQSLGKKQNLLGLKINL